MNLTGFGQYLLDQGLINREGFKKAVELQNKGRLLGDLGIELNWLVQDNISSILNYQREHSGVRFGEAAVSLSLLNSSQLKYLLDLRTRRKTPIGKILVNNGVITQETLNKALMGYNEKRNKFENILVVDPSTTIAMIIKSILSKYAYSTFHAKSGAEAIKLSLEVKPDILITSEILKDMNGFELCTRLLDSKKKYTSMHMVMLSSNDSMDKLENAFEAGIGHFLRKPVKENELINMIYQIEKDSTEAREEKVLVVDDSKGARMVISKEMLSNGFKVIMAENGKEALKMAQELKPDIITMDVEMPVMNGFEACRELKNDPVTREIPVVMISSNDSAKTKGHGFEAGAVEFFVKPFKSGKLAGHIHMLLETKKISRIEKILIAEDSVTTRHIIKYIFTKNGYNVIEAKDGRDALRLIQKNKPDLILTDCHMPEMNGFELTKEVKRIKETRHIPIIILTANTSQEDMLKGLEAGANDYLPKPFDEEELLARVKVHLLNKVLYDQIEQERNKYEQMYNEQSRILRDISILNTMSNKLQAVSSVEDSYSAINDSIQTLFPGDKGMIVLDNDDLDSCTVATTWGNGSEDLFGELPSSGCQALKKSGKVVCEKRSDDGSCLDVGGNRDGSHYCFVLSNEKDVLGTIHFYSKTGETGPTEGIKSEREYLMDMATEYISLSLNNARLRSKLLEQSIRDPLTGLFNRRYMEESLNREIIRAKRTNSKMGLLILDVDHFKRFNDEYGHLTGDCLLKGLGSLLGQDVRADDIVCRFGGEEFIVVLPGMDLKLAGERAEHIRSEVENDLKLSFNDETLKVTVSIGISIFPSNGQDGTKLIAAADKALYRAKADGRNKCVVAESDTVS
ncbi:MAG: response regulator [Candidatus Scalindua sp.]|nr:response regulator [Candidatus Scalindua sp.]